MLAAALILVLSGIVAITGASAYRNSWIRQSQPRHQNSTSPTFPPFSNTTRWSNSTNLSSNPSFLRGVNIGSWLILEKWMIPDFFFGTDAVDQWTFDQTPRARKKLVRHWSTFFTRDDVRQLAGYGINALRIPVGFWAYDNERTPHIRGADEYLERALHWARDFDMKVWVDLHGVPGSQNGFDNSGRLGNAEWQSGEGNMNRTIAVLKTMAAKYGARDWSDVVAAIELVNEPISWAQNNFTGIKEWAKEAYDAVRTAAENQELVIVMHDAFKPSAEWKDVAPNIDGKGKFALDAHLYQVYVDSDKALLQEEHIREACNWSKTALKPSTGESIPIYVGEWSAATNVCVNPDGTTSPGVSTVSDCKVAGCQCVADGSIPSANWTPMTKKAVRAYVESQLATFEEASSGYFFWSWKGPGFWSFVNGVEEGWIPKPVTNFKSPC
jgi:glucan 1,3-beta-glucosidase